MACNSSQKTVAPTTETPQEVTPVTYANTITEGELKEMLYTFASDEFEGRDTGKEGQKKAAAYLRDHYIELGIPAAQSNGDYYQKVPLVKLSVPEGSFHLEIQTIPLVNKFLRLELLQNLNMNSHRLYMQDMELMTQSIRTTRI